MKLGIKFSFASVQQDQSINTCRNPDIAIHRVIKNTVKFILFAVLNRCKGSPIISNIFPSQFFNPKIVLLNEWVALRHRIKKFTKSNRLVLRNGHERNKGYKNHFHCHKLIILFLFLISFSSFGQATFHSLISDGPALFVSLAGSGTESGDQPNNAMAFDDFLLETITANTRIYFNRGDSYNLEDYNLTVPASVDAFGSGADPIFSGSDDISGLTYTAFGGGIYYTPMVTEPKWVWMAGICAKNAERAVNIIDRPTTTTATVNTGTLDVYTSIVGAYMVMKENQFQNSQRVTITAFNPSTDVITFTGAVPNAEFEIAFVQNDVEFFSSNNEWVWADDTLWVKAAANPSTLDIRKTDATYGIKTTARLTVKNIEFEDYYTAAIWTDGGVPRVSECLFHDIRDDAILIQRGVEGVSITDNTFQRIGNTGIFARPLTNSFILRNTFTDIGMQDNYNFQTWFDGDGSIVINNVHGGGNAFAIFVDLDDDTYNGENVTVEYNVITNVAYRGISFGLGRENTIRFNRVDDFMNRFNDGGAIYTFHYRAMLEPNEFNEISYNVISNGNRKEFGVGIYMDGRSKSAHIHHNTIYDVEWGIFLNRDTQDHTVEFNNVMARLNGIIYRVGDKVGQTNLYTSIGNTLENNNIGVTGRLGKCIRFDETSSNPTFNPFSSGGNSDNNYFIKLIGPDASDIMYSEGLGTTAMTLAEYQAAFGVDASSVYQAFNPFMVSNYTAATSNEDAQSHYKDLDGVTLTTYTIDPYYSRLIAEIPFSNQLVSASSQYYNAGTTADIQFAHNVDFSISFWFKIAANPGANQIPLANLNSSTRGYNFLILASTGKLRFSCISTTGTNLLTLESGGDLADNVWHHVLAIKDAAHTPSELWIDGVADGTITTNTLTTTIVSTEDLFIGARNGPTQYTDMIIDEVAIWDSDQTANRSSIYSQGKTANMQYIEPRPIHYWRMGQTGDLLDLGSSANPLNLTPVNSPTVSTDVP